jgi:hypothetical protein
MGDVEEPKPLYRPIPATVAPALPPIKSRWQKGTLTFGPVGRLAWTFAASLPGVWWITAAINNGFPPADPLQLVGSLFGLVFVVTWFGWIWHRIMRDVWAKETVYVPQPAMHPVKLLTDANGDRLPTLEEYVAGQTETALD